MSQSITKQVRMTSKARPKNKESVLFSVEYEPHSPYADLYY